METNPGVNYPEALLVKVSSLSSLKLCYVAHFASPRMHQMHASMNLLFHVYRELEPIMTATPCGVLVVANSDHKDGHNKNSTTFDKVNVTCDSGYVGGKSTAVCSPDGPKKSKWKINECQG